jgi:hypothetical protein
MIFRQHLGVLVIGRMTPGNMLAKVYPVGQHRLAEFEQLRKHPAGTGRDHYSIESFAGNVILDKLHARFGAEGIVALAATTLQEVSLMILSTAMEAPMSQPLQI